MDVAVTRTADGWVARRGEVLVGRAEVVVPVGFEILTADRVREDRLLTGIGARRTGGFVELIRQWPAAPPPADLTARRP